MARRVLLAIVFVVMSIQSGYANMKTAYDYLEAEKYELAYKEFKALADKGNPEAMNELALLYDAGKGVAKDGDEAFKLYERAANKGFSTAQYNVGLCYYNGRFVPKDIKLALKWYNLAANNGDVDAQNMLGLIYSTGDSDIRDFKKALKWYRKSAASGDSGGQYSLATMYRDGEGVPKNIKEATKLFKKSAEQGNGNAKKALAKLNAPKSFSFGDRCRIIGRSAACGFNIKTADNLIRSSYGGNSYAAIAAIGQYEASWEMEYDIAKADLISNPADFKCRDTKKELQELITSLKN